MSLIDRRTYYLYMKNKTCTPRNLAAPLFARRQTIAGHETLCRLLTSAGKGELEVEVELKLEAPPGKLGTRRRNCTEVEGRSASAGGQSCLVRSSCK